MIPSSDSRLTAGSPEVFARLAEAGLTRVGVPTSLGGTGGGRDEALREVMRLQQTDHEAAAALASHQCVIGVLLAGRNVGLRDHRIPALARGNILGIWPSSAIDDMLHRGIAAVQALETGQGLRLTGPLGHVNFGGRHPFVLLCPVQWSAAHPPGLALLDGEQDGLRLAALHPSVHGAPDRKLVSLDNVFFRAEEFVDADGSRIAMMAELQALHTTVRSWLDRTASTNSVFTGSLVRDDRE